MAAALGSLVVSLEANTAQFTSAMDKAAYQTDKAMRDMMKNAEAVGQAIGALGVAAAGALAVMIQNSLDAADNLRDMAQKTGIAVETLNGMGFAASQAGGSLDGMVSAAGKLNKSIAEAASGNKETSEAFKLLGIDVLDASGNLKKADVVMAEIADRFEEWDDGPEKSAIAAALFSKAGADMIPVLNDGGAALHENTEYAREYSNMTQELADAADNFNDTMGKLTVQQTSFANAITSAVMPVLQAVADEILKASEQSNKFELASDVVRTVLEALVVVASEVAFTFKAVGAEIGGVASQLAALATLDVDGFTFIGKAMKEDAEQARIEHDKFIARILDRTPAVVVADNEGLLGSSTKEKPAAPRLPSSSAVKARSIKTGKSEEEKIAEDAQRMITRLKEQAEAYGKSGAALLEYQLAQSKMPQTYKDEAMALQVRIDALKADDEANKRRAAEQKKAEEDARRAAEQNAANVENIRIGLMTEMEQEQLAHELRLTELQKFHDAKLENVSTANALIEAENARHVQTMAEMQAAHEMEKLGMMGNSADQLYSLMQKAGMEQTALGKAVFLASKAIAVAEIVMNTEVAAAKAQAQFGVYGTPMAMAIRVAGYASAGLVAGMAVAEVSGAREKGGPVWGGGAFLVGEKGPEIFKPSSHGTIIPNSQIGGGGGEMKLTIVNNTRVPIGQVTEQRISPTEKALIIQEAVSTMAAQFADPNSSTSRSFSRNYASQRSR